MDEDDRYRQYEELVESVISEDFDKYEEKILAQGWMSSVQQLRLLNRLRERLRPVEIPEHCKSQEQAYTNDHSYFLHQHGRGG